MGAIVNFNRRLVFAFTFLIVFICGIEIHTFITGNNHITNVLEFVVLLGVSLGCAYFAARRFPPVGRRL